MNAAAIIAAIAAGEQIIAGAVQAYEAVKGELSSDDLAAVQAALDTAAAQRRADVARIVAALTPPAG